MSIFEQYIFKKFTQRQQKAGKVGGTKKKQLKEHAATNQFN